MSYEDIHILRENLGNNSFAWETRQEKYGKSPTLVVPRLIEGTLGHIQIGDDIEEETENKILRSCKGLKHFVRMSPGTGSDTEVVVFDNHNHALYFWIDAVRRGLVEKGFELIHIDEHSDLWLNDEKLDLDRAIADEKYAWKFTNLSCNVGNYIEPALHSGLIKKMIRIESEYQIDEYLNYTPLRNSILNIDIDIFAPELEYIPESKKLTIIRNLLKKVSYVTIATSPYFIEQGKALQKLHQVLGNEA